LSCRLLLVGLLDSCCGNLDFESIIFMCIFCNVVVTPKRADMKDRSATVIFFSLSRRLRFSTAQQISFCPSHLQSQVHRSSSILSPCIYHFKWCPLSGKPASTATSKRSMSCCGSHPLTSSSKVEFFHVLSFLRTLTS